MSGPERIAQVRPLDPPHSWHVVDAPSGAEVAGEDALDEALLRDHVTLTYGYRCFELTRTVEAGGTCFLRLSEVGRLSRTGSGRSVLVFASGGYRAEQRIAPCHDALDGAVMRDLDAQARSALGRALLDEAARALDSEVRAA